MGTYTPQHRYDALPSTPDTRDFLAPPIDAAALPDHVALPSVPVLDQGAEGSCVGHGCAGARETLDLLARGGAVQIDSLGIDPVRTTLTVVPLSRAFIYYRARLLEHSSRTDSGAEVRDGCKVLQKNGVCTEAAFPYSDRVFARAPTRAEIAAAGKYKIAAYTRLTNATQVRAALAAGHPVVIGISVYQSFETSVGSDGRVPMPDTAREQLLGGHCLYLHGYHPDPAHPGAFLFDGANSWGTAWGDGGHFHMPEGYLNDAALCSDLWSIAR